MASHGAPTRTASVSGRKDSKGTKSKPESEKNPAKSPSHMHKSESHSGFFSRMKLHPPKREKSITVDPCLDGGSSPGYNESPGPQYHHRTSVSSTASSTFSTSGPLPSPKQTDSQMSLDKFDSVPSIPEPIKKGHVRILLPNKQRTMIRINNASAPLDEALHKAMRLRKLAPENCLVFRLTPQKRALGWKACISEVDGEEISVEDKFNTRFENPHRYVSKGQMGVGPLSGYLYSFSPFCLAETQKLGKQF